MEGLNAKREWSTNPCHGAEFSLCPVLSSRAPRHTGIDHRPQPSLLTYRVVFSFSFGATVIYQHLFNRTDAGQAVRAAIIGAGDYATAIVIQARSIPRLDAPDTADATGSAVSPVTERQEFQGV